MKSLVKRLLVAVAAFIGCALAYGVMIEPRLILEEERLDVELPGLSDVWSGEQVAVLADLQIGMWLANEGMVRRAVDLVVAEDPAAVLLLGDFVYSESPEPSEQVDEVMRLLAPLIDAGLALYAVMGNHDYAVGAVDELRAAFREAGISVLHNEALSLLAPGRGPDSDLYLVGVGPARPGEADVEQALDGVPEDAPRLVMMHNPTSFPEFPAHAAPFAVAGHTHCGQIALPGTPRWSYMGLTAEETLVADGFAPSDYGNAGNTLFVSCGIGFSLIPVRINAPPQVVFLELSGDGS